MHCFTTHRPGHKGHTTQPEPKRPNALAERQPKRPPEKLLAEARMERDKILKEASEAGNNIVETAKQKANEEGGRMIAQAREAIENEKRAAITEVKNMAAVLSVDIAERILRKELSNPQAQQELAKDYIKEVTLN